MKKSDKLSSKYFQLKNSSIKFIRYQATKGVSGQIEVNSHENYRQYN